jgi:uncharacterized protein
MTPTQQAHIEATERFVQETLRKADGSHDWQHIVRVRALAERIGRDEQADPFVVSMGALLHDIADHKYHGGDKEIGPRVAREWLESIGVDAAVTEQVVEIVQTISFSGPHGKQRMRTLEGSIVRDADRLEAIGAIGIARAFTYGGSKNRALYDPEIPPSQEEGIVTTPTINHFHEKLFKLKSLMETGAGARVAEDRHAYMQGYLERFQTECEGAA